MRWIAIAWAALAAAGGQASAAVPLYDPVVLNIGLSCQWQRQCISRQQRAMKAARKYVAKSNPPLWRVHLCNRNAARSPERIDWIGFNNCIRNAALREPPPPRPKARRHKRH